EEVPNAAFADVWKQLATHFRDQDERLAYGIMNEPHGTKGLWKAAAQAAVDAIRSVDQKHIITVCGDGWSGAHSWQKYNKDLILQDPTGKLVYEAHQYFDKDNSGTYKRSYDSDGATPETGVKRLQPFIEWLEEHQLRGFIGEFGVPDNDPRWLVVLDNALAEMQAHQVGGTYWAAGPWWNKYPLSIEPQNGQDRPQMAVLDFYLDTGNVQSKKPWLAAAELADRAARKNQEDDARLGKRIYDFRDKAESYHFTNEGSEYSSELLEQVEEKSRGISFRHIGDPAWVGIGVYYGNLKCEQSDHFLLEARAEQPCSLELKVYSPDGKKFTARCQVTSEWQTFKLPFEEFKNGDLSLSTVKEIQKIEFQPSVSRQGNRLELRTLRMPAGSK
ncbi:MAG: cellulase family glycosylhydrolase, partial [Planctomycetaceae bacterium]|nr:cellulase family glycosylhydrolase [Planctomycetaceae bacterium]